MTNTSLRKKCLIVLGMHRSGTSALAGALHLTGFDLGQNIMPPADENPKGFFENQHIVDLNDRILEEMFTFWNEPFFIPEDWWKKKKFEPYKTKISELLRDEFSSGEPILVKDPRLCVLLPLYLDVFNTEGIEPEFVVCVRNPMEVADSLKRRNNLPLEKSLLIWMDYQLKAEWYSRGYRRAFIDYDEFLHYPVETTRKILLSLEINPGMNEKTGQDILAFLDLSLTHKTIENELSSENYLPDFRSFFHLQIAAHLRDFNDEEVSASDHYRKTFINNLRFWNGMPSKYSASLTVDIENHKKTVHSVEIHFGENHLEFNLNPVHQVSRLTLRPCNSRVGLRLIGTNIYSAQNQIIDIGAPDNSAGSRNEQGYMVFENDLPKIIFNFKPAVALSKVEFMIDYLAFGLIPNRRMMWRKS